MPSMPGRERAQGAGDRTPVRKRRRRLNRFEGVSTATRDAIGLTRACRAGPSVHPGSESGCRLEGRSAHESEKSTGRSLERRARERGGAHRQLRLVHIAGVRFAEGSACDSFMLPGMGEGSLLTAIRSRCFRRWEAAFLRQRYAGCKNLTLSVASLRDESSIEAVSDVVKVSKVRLPGADL